MPLSIHSKWLVPLMLLSITVGQMAIDIYLPSMPSIVHALSTSQSLVQLTFSFFSVGFGLSQLFYGPLSDRFGRRRLLLTGFSIYFIGSIACSFSTSIDMLIVSRFIQGAGAGAGAVLTRAIMRDAFTGVRIAQVSTYISIAWALVPIIAPVFGSYIEKYLNWRMNFVALALFSGALILLIAKQLPDTNIKTRLSELRLHHVVTNYIAIVKNPVFLKFMLGPTLMYSITISYATVAPFLYQTDLGLTPVAFGWISLIVGSGYLLGNLCNIQLLRRFEKKTLIRFGIVLISIAAFTLALLAMLGFFNVYVLAAPMILLMFGGGFIFANCVVEALMPFPHLGGTAAAMLGCLQVLIASLSSMLISFLPSHNQISIAVLLLVFSIVLLLVLFNAKSHETLVHGNPSK